MAYRKLGRNSSNRKALFRSILSSFIKHERIETTVTKAKEVSSHVAKLITLAKQGDLHARRQVLAVLVDEDVYKRQGKNCCRLVCMGYSSSNYFVCIDDFILHLLLYRSKREYS